jgi:hypothetical protein
MRIHHQAIAVAALILVGFGVKTFFFSVRTAEADHAVIKGTGIDVSSLQHDKKLPLQNVRDLSFVFVDGD